MPPTYPFERPLGAFPTGDGAARFRVWAPRPERGARCASATASTRWPTPATASARRPSRPRPATTTPTSSTARARPTRTRAGSPRACAGRRGVSTRRLRRGPTRASSAPALRDLVRLRAARRHVHRRGHVRRGDPAPARAARARRHAIELMPVADFPGRRGWGYDGVYFWAAHDAYGGPDGLQRLVDAAHAAGLAVILDLVYNHVGASGEQALRAFGPYFTDQLRDVLGRGDQLRRRAVRRRARVGAPERRACGSATSTSTACASTRSTRSSTPAPSTSSPRSRAACTPATRARS